MKRPDIFDAIAHAASLGHCPQHQRANYKILNRDVYIYINFIIFATIVQNLQRLFNSYLLPNQSAYKIINVFLLQARCGPEVG